MSAANPATNRSESLLAFCRKIGILDTETMGPEGLSDYELSKTITAGKLKLALASDYEGLVAVFRESLSMEVALQSVSQLEIKNGFVDELQAGIDRIATRDSPTELKLDIKIDKTVVINQLTGVDETQYNGIFYLFEEKLISLFGAPLLKLDESVFAKTRQSGAGVDSLVRDTPTLIVVSDADIHFSGEMLTIVGERVLAREPGLLEMLRGRLRNEDKGSATTEQEDANQVNVTKLAGCLSRLHLPGLLGSTATAALREQKEALTLSNATLQEQITKYRRSALENPSLVGHQFVHLTPLHFLGEWKAKGNGAVVAELARHLLNICILYTANRSTFSVNEEPLESIYNSADRTATLSLKDKPTGVIPTTSLEALARWLHSGKGTDQRTVLQNVVARELDSDDPKVSYSRFITRSPQLLKDAIWQYQVFIDGKITRHFEELQKVIGYIADVNKKISEALDSVTKSLTDALLATVGVLVLTVLAALVKKDASIAVFRISMQVYSGYLLFYAVYRMGSIVHSYWLLNQEASAQLAKYQDALRAEKIAELSSPLSRRKKQFQIWFGLTVVLYLALAGSIYWAGNKGPQFLIDRGIITAPSIETPVAS